MTFTVPPHHRQRPVATAVLTAAALVLSLAAPAAAQPNPAPTTPPNETGTPTLATLRANLEAASVGYIEAENQLTASKAKQAELQKQLERAEIDMGQVREGVARYAGEAYKTGRLGVLGTMLAASTPDEFLSRAAALDKMTQRDQNSLIELMAAKRRVAEAKLAIEAEIAVQTAAAQEMAKRKKAAELALAAVGGGPSASRVNVNGAVSAKPAPRNPDGSWPRESCSISDPTPASGCITPRTLHALNQAKAAGFNWYVSCYRSGGDGEHPKGRACDFAAFRNGFENRSAGGENKSYGDRLAAFYVKNARALAVMYVVWYCQIWQVSTGWRRYNSSGSNCGDSPAGDHTNHVHVSIY